MKLLTCFILLGLFVALVAANEAAKTSDESIQSADGNVPSARARFTLPKIFDFTRFKQLFKKSYSSVVEELARQKLFLGNAFRAVISMVKYKYEKMDHYLSVNQLSDKSPEELKKRQVSADKIRNKLAPADQAEDGDEDSAGDNDIDESSIKDSADDELPVADIDDIKQVIEEVKSHKDEPGYKEIAEVFEQTEGQVRHKRDANVQQNTRKISLDNLIPDESVILEGKLRLAERVPSNNPSYEPLEMTSYGAEEQPSIISSLSSSLIDMISKVPGSEVLSSMVKRATQVLSSPKKSQHTILSIPDAVYVDHRQSGCFNPIRDQDDCGSCYAFTAIAYFEWMYCAQTGRLAEFSEQYIIDCGKYLDLGGCDGGGEDGTAEFVHKFGLQLRPDYPYLVREDECPYVPETELRKTGYIRLKKTGYRYVKLREIDDFLLEQPIMVGIRLNDDFSFYGGGVDEMIGCSEENGHLMLLIGHGVQDGKKYYLFRNSYSIAWGEEGYYKVSKKAFRRCATDPHGGISTGMFAKHGPMSKQNPLFDPSVISTKKYNNRY